MAEVHVKGLAALQKALDTLPVQIESKIMRGALRAGAKVIMQDAKARCPVGPPSSEGARLYGHYQGALRDSIRITGRVKNGTVSASVKAGGKTKSGAQVYYASIIEFTGAAAHIIKSRRAQGFLFFAGSVYRTVNHPGMAARPFMRPAMEGRAQDALMAIGEYIKGRLSKEGVSGAGSIALEAGD